jgi:glutamyl-tRNA reductase
MSRKCANCKNNGSKWYLAVCGINHKSASISERAPLALGHEDFAQAHLELMNFENVYEAVAVSTCNRVEYYLVLDREIEPFSVIRHFYINFRKLDISELEEKFYIKKELLAVEHLFGVVGGLDSMVLGESQIFGQIKESYSSACAIKTAGKIIHHMFHQAFRTGKIVRTHTELTGGVSSVSGAAVKMLKEKINGNKELPILFIGANQMIHLAASSLHKSGYRKFTFVNRTESKAIELAEKYGGQGYSLTEVGNLLNDIDVIITCTGATEPILDESDLKPVIEANPDKKLLVMDMAIPRDVAEVDSFSERLRIFDLEDVDKFLKSNQRKRAEAIPTAEKIIDRKLSEFGHWYEHAQSEPLTVRVEYALERIRKEEIAEIAKYLDPETTKKIENFSTRLIQRLLTTNRRCKKGH